MPGSTTGRRRHRSKGLEDEALDRLMAHLRARGHHVALAARPDREGRTGRAVDAELRIDGDLVGVEITQLLPAARAHYEIARLERRIEALLAAEVKARHLGYVLIAVHYHHLPPKKTLRAAEPNLAADIAAAMRMLRPRPTARNELSVETNVAFIRNLELIQLPDSKDGIGWIGGSDEFGGWIAPMADNFVVHLLEVKGPQTAGYREACIVIVDRVGLLDASDVAAALGRHADRIPRNWKKVWFLPASDRHAVVTVPLP